MTSQSAVMATVVVASAVNVAGTALPTASDAGKDPLIPIVAGFVIGGILLAVAGAAPGLAEAFAAAFLITSLLSNGTPVINAVTGLTTKPPHPFTQS
jgi:hypothetical protein